MNLAFPALVLLALALPGLLFRFAYAKGPGRWNTPTTLRELGDEVIVSALLAWGIHLFWIPVTKKLGCTLPDLAFVMVLLSKGEAKSWAPLTDHVRSVTLYLTSVYGLSFLLGLAAHAFVRTTKLDRRTRLFRFKNDWHYWFSGEVQQFYEQHAERAAAERLIRELQQFQKESDHKVAAARVFLDYAGQDDEQLDSEVQKAQVEAQSLGDELLKVISDLESKSIQGYAAVKTAIAAIWRYIRYQWHFTKWRKSVRRRINRSRRFRMRSEAKLLQAKRAQQALNRIQKTRRSDWFFRKWDQFSYKVPPPPGAVFISAVVDQSGVPYSQTG